MKKYINPEHVRKDEQKIVMNEIAKQNHCPFCTDNLLKYHKKPILKKGKYWIITDNQWPYDKIKHQLLAIYKDHIEHLNDMNPKAGEELIRLFQEEIDKRKIPGGGLAMRFGGLNKDGSYGNTVFHLHAHLIEPDLKALGPNETWKFKFGQSKEYKK